MKCTAFYEAFLPGVYYYVSRYAYPHQRIIHILKVWMLYPLLLVLFNALPLARWPAVLLAWLAFLNLYDVFCQENDVKATHREKAPTFRVGKIARLSITWRIVSQILIMCGYVMLSSWASAVLMAALLLITSTLFYTHNRLPEKVRFITYYNLYLTKGLLFYCAVDGAMTDEQSFQYILFCFLFNAAYLPKYLVRKKYGWMEEQVFTKFLGVRKLSILPLFYKNIALLGLSLLHSAFGLLLIWVDLWTGVEAWLNKRTSMLCESCETVRRLDVLGIQVHTFTMASLHETVANAIERGDRALIPNVNVHALNLAADQPWFADFLNSADYVMCDGHGVMLGARILGVRIPEKITYAHWFPLFCEFCAQRKYTLYFLGSRPGVAQNARDALCARFPALSVTGWHHGYFDKRPGSVENEEVLTAIMQTRPHILLVAFGMPLQEQWLRDHWSQLDVPIGLTGGAVLDYMAGEIKRPPAWLTATGFEWLGRLAYEPGRLWKRYLLGNPKFLWRIIRAKLRSASKPQPNLVSTTDDTDNS